MTAEEILNKHKQAGLPATYTKDICLAAMREMYKMGWMDSTEYNDDCNCGKCSYCVEVKDGPVPSEEERLKQLFPEKL